MYATADIFVTVGMSWMSSSNFFYAWESRLSFYVRAIQIFLKLIQMKLPKRGSKKFQKRI